MVASFPSPALLLPLALAATGALAQTAPGTATTDPTPPPSGAVAYPAERVVVPVPTVAAPAPRTYPKLSDAQAAALGRMLDDGPRHGIILDPAVASLSTGKDEVSRRMLIDAAMSYATKLRTGQLRGADFAKDWGMRPVPYDPWGDFAQAVAGDRVAGWIAALPPPYTGYTALKSGLATYRKIDKAGGWKQIAGGEALGIGATGERVKALRERLRVEDDSVAESGAYDRKLAEAVQRAQKRYGVDPTGVLGPATTAALNVTARERIDQIVANMERWRWLPRDLPQHRIQVNIAAAVLTMFEGDAPKTSMRAVTGRPGDNTPMLASSIHSVVLNPPWNVPTSIATKELWPKQKKSPGYFAREQIKVIKLDGGGTRLQQAAGPKSALGRVKFDFENPYGVYLHDTPARGGFDNLSRLASHGCVRLQRPLDLAKMVLDGDAIWTPDAVDAAIADGKTVRARLPEPVNVYLLYWTAFGSGEGKVALRADPYGWDKELASRIVAGATRIAAR